MTKLTGAIEKALADPGDPLFGLLPSEFGNAIKGLSPAALAEAYEVNLQEYSEIREAMEQLERDQRGLDPAGQAVLAMYAPILARWGNAATCRRHRASSVTQVCGALAHRVKALGEALEALYLAGTPRPAEQAAAMKEIENIDIEVVKLSEESHEARGRFRRAGGFGAPAPLLKAQQQDSEARGAKLAELQERRREALARARRFSWVSER